MTHASADSLFKPAVVLMSGRALGFLATFALPVVLARTLDLAEFGTYKQLFLIYSTLYCIGQLGMAESLFFFLPGAPRQGGRYALNAMLAGALAGVACLALLWLLEPAIAVALNNPALAGLLPLVGTFLLLMLLSAVLEIVMTARKRHLQASATYAVSDFARTALLIVPVVWLGGLDALLLGAIAFAALRLAATLLYLYREYDGDLAPDAAAAKAQLLYAAPFAAQVLFDTVQASLHFYAVSMRFDAATFAIYAVGCMSIPVVDFLMGSACNVMMVRMRERLLAGERAAVMAIWTEMTRKLALVFAPLVFGLLAVAHELVVVLYTGSYERSVPVFVVWTLPVLFMAVMTDGALRVFAQMRFLMGLGLLKLALVAATIGFLMDALGLAGAVLSVLLATVVAKVLALLRLRTVMRCRFAEVLPWARLAGILAIAALAALPALAVKAALDLPALARLLVAGLVYAVTYLGLLLRTGALSDAEALTLLGWAQRPVARQT